MTFMHSRLVVSLFIFLVSLGAAYGTLQPLTHDSASNTSQKLHTELNLNPEVDRSFFSLSP